MFRDALAASLSWDSALETVARSNTPDVALNAALDFYRQPSTSVIDALLAQSAMGAWLRQYASYQCKKGDAWYRALERTLHISGAGNLWVAALSADSACWKGHPFIDALQTCIQRQLTTIDTESSWLTLWANDFLNEVPLLFSLTRWADWRFNAWVFIEYPHIAWDCAAIRNEKIHPRTKRMSPTEHPGDGHGVATPTTSDEQRSALLKLLLDVPGNNAASVFTCWSWTDYDPNWNTWECLPWFKQDLRVTCQLPAQVVAD